MIFSKYPPQAVEKMSLSANFIVATPHCGARSLKFENEIDEISATGGRKKSLSANFIVVTAHWAAHSLKFENKTDIFSATGGCRFDSSSISSLFNLNIYV